jgi:hypothetical protein
MKQMKQSILLRTASLLSLIFCAGHTYGTLKPSSRGPEEAAVFMAMQAYPFNIMGFRRTHWDFYRGFSLLFSVTLLMLAVLLWQLGGMSKSDPARIRPLIAVLGVGYLGYTVLCGTFFFTAPAVVAASATLCIALAFTSAQ